MIRKIDIADKAQIEDIRKRYKHTYSSHAFNVLYCWKDVVGDELFMEDDIFSLRYTAKGENTWLFPVGSEAKKIEFIESHLTESGFALCYLRDEDAEFLKTHFAGRFECRPVFGDAEYVYDVDKQIALPGRKYKKLRYMIQLAQRKNPDIKCVDITEDNLDDAKRVVCSWTPKEEEGGSLQIAGNEADVITLENFAELDIYGILMYKGDEPVGCALGFGLTDDTCDFMIKKLCIDDPVLGYYLGWMFTKKAAQMGSLYINYEDDLDIPGLREYKLILHPDIMNYVFEAEFTGGCAG